MLSTTLRRTLSAVCVGAVLIGAGSGSASALSRIDTPVSGVGAAASPAVSAAVNLPSVTVPRHLSQATQVQLLGVSDAGIAVRQGADRLLSGPPGSKLVHHGQMDRTDAVLVGDLLTWSETTTSPAGTVLHRVNIGTGVDSPLTTTLKPLAATTDGYLALAGRTLTRYVIGGPDVPLLDNVTKVTAIKVQGDDVIVSYDDPVEASNMISIVPLAGGPRTWFQVTEERVHHLAFSDTLVGWVETLGSDPPAVFTRPRVGGRVNRLATLATETAESPEFAVAGDRAAWPKNDHQINVLTKETVSTRE